MNCVGRVILGFIFSQLFAHPTHYKNEDLQPRPADQFEGDMGVFYGGTPLAKTSLENGISRMLPPGVKQVWLVCFYQL